MALVAVVSCVRKTHIGCILEFRHSSRIRGYYDAFADAGQAALREESGCSPGRHCPGRVLLRLPLHRRAAGRSCCVSIIAGLGVTPQTGKTQDSCTVSSLFSVNTSGRAGLLRWAAGRRNLELARHRPRSCFFRSFLLAFSSVDLPVVLSILCCLPINDGSSVFGAQSRHRVLIFLVPCRVVSIWAPWSSMLNVFLPQVFF